MSFLRLVKGAVQAPLRHLPESSKKSPYTFALNILSLIRKAPKAAFNLAILGFGGTTTYYSYKAYQGYKTLKNEAKEAFSPISKALEKLGVKEPEVKEKDLEEKISSFFGSIITSASSLRSYKEINPLLIEKIERLEQKIALPPKENTSSANPLATEKPSKDLKSAISSLIKTGETRIVHELECKKTELKKEINDSDDV